MLTLYGYPLSSAAYRVRIALALKGIKVSTVNKQLRRGEHRQKDFLKINPQGFVPVLLLPDGTVLTQSLAIIEWLEESHPRPALLPADPSARARVRSLCQLIACDIHPLNNLRVLQYLESSLTVAQAAPRGVVPALGRDGICRARGSARPRCGTRTILLRGSARYGRRVSGAADLQRAPLLGRFDALSAHRRHRRGVRRAAGFCKRCTREAAVRRILKLRLRRSAGGRFCGYRLNLP